MSSLFTIGILNGGKSQRMGTPKSLLIYNERTLIENIYNLSLKFASNVVILGESPIPESIKDKVTVLKDSYFLGPLGGIKSAFDYKKTDWLFIAVDMLLINRTIIEYILEVVQSSGYVLPFRKDINKYEPLFAYYSLELLEKIFSLEIERNEGIQKVLQLINADKNTDIIDKFGDRIASFNTIDEFNKII